MCAKDDAIHCCYPLLLGKVHDLETCDFGFFPQHLFIQFLDRIIFIYKPSKWACRPFPFNQTNTVFWSIDAWSQKNKPSKCRPINNCRVTHGLIYT